MWILVVNWPEDQSELLLHKDNSIDLLPELNVGDLFKQCNWSCLGLTTIVWTYVALNINIWGKASLIFPSDPSFCGSFITPVLLKWSDCYKCVDSVYDLRLDGFIGYSVTEFIIKAYRKLIGQSPELEMFLWHCLFVNILLNQAKLLNS